MPRLKCIASLEKVLIASFSSVMLGIAKRDAAAKRKACRRPGSQRNGVKLMTASARVPCTSCDFTPLSQLSPGYALRSKS